MDGLPVWPLPHAPPPALLQAITKICERAGDLALADFRPGARTLAQVHLKQGGSPVTDADLRVDAFLQSELANLLPDAGWLSEETADTRQRLSQDMVFVVDPIDGTRAFVEGDPRWGVSVALVAQGVPVLGVVHMPALGETYAASRGQGATFNGQALPRACGWDDAFQGPVTCAGPKLLIAGMAQVLAASGCTLSWVPKIPSLAYRFVCVGTGHLGAALASTHAQDWDIAAADLIAHETGACVVDVAGQAPRYNRAETSHGVLLAAPHARAVRLRSALAQVLSAAA